MKRIPDSIKMEIIAKISTDMTQREIAKELKVSDGYVAKVAKEVNHASVDSAGRNPILSDTTKRHSILKFKMGGYATATAASRAIVPIIKAKISPETKTEGITVKRTKEKGKTTICQEVQGLDSSRLAKGYSLG
ncbi:hypothetical protein G6F69_009268 [Rhizopus microsporus]|nr:hypothetical protein G6F69_009268 [Rhizopus microsporus]